MPNKKINPLDFKDDIAIGVDLPMNSGNGGFALNYLTEDQIHANLKNLILTMKGERIMHPTFGSGLHNLLFEPGIQDSFYQKSIETMTEAVNEWMPFVTIDDADLIFDGNVAKIQISYKVKELDIKKVLSVSVKVI